MFLIFRGAEKGSILFSLSQSQLKNLTDDKHGIGSSWRQDKGNSSISMQIDLEKQLDCWRENPSWTDQIPVVKVSKR